MKHTKKSTKTKREEGLGSWIRPEGNTAITYKFDDKDLTDVCHTSHLIGPDKA